MVLQVRKSLETAQGYFTCWLLVPGAQGFTCGYLLQVQEEPGSQQFLSRGLAEGWERCLTDDSVPYFVSHGSSSTQWDHPAFVTLLAQLAAMNTVKFSAYRCVAKLLSRVLLYYCNVLFKGWP